MTGVKLLIAAGTMIAWSHFLAADTEPGELLRPPTSPIGITGTISSVVLIFWILWDRRKLQAADTAAKILEMKDKLISHLTETCERCEKEAMHWQQEFEKCRGRSHNISNYCGALMKKLSDNKISIPSQPDFDEIAKPFDFK